MPVDVANPLLLVMGALSVLGSVVALLFTRLMNSYERALTEQRGAYERALSEKDAHIQFVEGRIQIGDQREQAWRETAERADQIIDGHIAALRDATSALQEAMTELKTTRRAV